MAPRIVNTRIKHDDMLDFSQSKFLVAALALIYNYKS